MSKLVQMIVMVLVASVAWPTLGGVRLNLEFTGHNSLEQDVWVIGLSSDGAPITSIGIDVIPDPDSTLYQVHPFGLSTVFQDSNAVIQAVGKQVDEDTQVMLYSGGLIVVPDAVDTEARFTVNFTGVNITRATDILQVVLPCHKDANAVIKAVSDGQEYTFRQRIEYIPEPASLGLLGMGMLAVMRRR